MNWTISNRLLQISKAWHINPPSLNDHGCKISKSSLNRSNTGNVSLGTEYSSLFFTKQIRPLNFVPVQMPDYEALNHSLIRCHVVFYPHFNHVIGETTILNVPYITQSATEDDKTEPSQARDIDFLSRRWLGSELWSRENFRSTLRFINYMLYDSFNLVSVINKQLMNRWPMVCIMSIFMFWCRY